ncbi:MAG: efflux RND transporter periplasmic adaptor subunit [Deltaproteobacteria bacterium]|jgi:membrane fusion protein, copper/silver efflux system|nr:efflux RND transporter periplasmic adaptor subunit [Deltaproteobacteria bacterium]
MNNATATKRAHLMGLLSLTSAWLVLSMLGGCERWTPSRADPDSVSAEIASGYYIRPSEKATVVHAADGRQLMMIPHLQSQEGSIGTVREVPLPGVLEATGLVTFDDRLVSTISSRVAGRIEEMRTSQWEMVERGRVVMVLFSPDFMTAEEEYLQATSGRSNGRSTPAETSYGMPVHGVDISTSLRAAAIRKLELLGFSPADIAAIRVPSTSVAMRAPISGIIVSNNAMRGQQVNPGDQLFSLATLQRVWITADIYQSDMSRVRIGQNLEAVTAPYPGEIFKGTVQRISPALDPNIHTMQLRCQVDNPRSLLRPQMLARVRLITPPGLALVIPQKALVFDNNAYFAFIVAGPDAIERRRVAIGDWKEPGFARVVNGIQPGDRFLTESLKFNSLWHAARSKT